MLKLYRAKETPILETERFFLRKFREEDAEDVFAYASNTETTQFVTWNAHGTLDDSRRFLKWNIGRYNNRELSDWAILDKASGVVIGAIGLVFIEERNRCCEVGYVVDQKQWGKAIMPECLERVLQFLFAECGFNRVQAMYSIENGRSGRVLEKAGFVREGTLVQRVFLNDRFHDCFLCAIHVKTWQANHMNPLLDPDEVTVEEAEFNDLTDILLLQKKAYRQEAELYGGGIAPMTQTLEMIEASFKDLLFLKAVAGGHIVGSVRIRIAEGTCYIGRLIVEPDLQHQGIGRHMMGTVEALYPHLRFELFTGHLSQRNIEMYEKAGYKPFKTVRVKDRESLVYLEKMPVKSLE